MVHFDHHDNKAFHHLTSLSILTRVSPSAHWNVNTEDSDAEANDSPPVDTGLIENNDLDDEDNSHPEPEGGSFDS